MQNENKFFLLLNSINIPFTCISYFITSGMKDDSIRGISHLTEHVIIEELIKDMPEVFQENLINAYVDKEFTCFHATVLSENVESVLKSFGKMFCCADTGLSKEIIQNQKRIILDIENERTLSNPQLLNILAIEQLAFEGRVRIPTLIDVSFKLLGENEIKNCLKNQYYSACHYLIITGAIPLEKSAILHYFRSVSDNLVIGNKVATDTRIMNFSISTKRLSDVNEARKTTAITFHGIKTASEYYALHILCLFYKICINNMLKDKDFFLKDVSFKLYSEKDIIFFTYSNVYNGTCEVLKRIDIKGCSDLFQKLKMHFLFGYLQKSFHLLDFNKEVFKLKQYLHETLNFENMTSFINAVRFDNVMNLHNNILKGNYFFISEEYYDGYIREI